MKKKTIKPENIDVLHKMAKEEAATDVLGSWTGTPRDGDEPVQDVDDL